MQGKKTWVASQEAFALGLDLDHLSLSLGRGGLKEIMNKPLVLGVISNVVLEALSIDLKGPMLFISNVNCTERVHLLHLEWG